MKTKMRLEGFTLTVKNVKRSVDFYTQKLGFACEWDAAPHFAMLRVGGPSGGTIGLLAWSEAKKDGAVETTAKQKRAIHVELSTDDLDGLYKELRGKSVKFHAPPHDEPWERSATALDPDGYSVEFAQGRRGKKKK
jgi:catechol 2,3-dioxygenase-like lactoylglutathione lyase family enzyme